MEQDPNTIRRGRSVPYAPSPKSYALTGKIMLSAIVILFTAVLLILFIHVYVRCCLFRLRRNRLRRSRLAQHPHSTSSSSRGLDASVLRSLPVFVFSTKTHQDTPECAVCLSEFEESEKGRRLPKCNHSFHIDCIDMWFHSHSTCPLCRAPVKPDSAPPNPPPDVENPAEIAVGVAGAGNSHMGPSSSGACSEETGPSSSSPSSGSGSSSSGVGSSSSFSTKALGFVRLGIEVPPRRGLDDVEIVLVSPAGQTLKSPGGRILSLKRILSRDRRAGVFSSSSSPVPSPVLVTETDLERGEESGNRAQTQS